MSQEQENYEEMLMKAIETTYNGIKYRSRTEARWAAFFDAYDVDFVYEPEGYEINGLRYLVDFWIPEWNCYIEVKNTESTRELTDGLEKASYLSIASSKRVIIVNGPPSIHESFLFVDGKRL